MNNQNAPKCYAETIRLSVEDRVLEDCRQGRIHQRIVNQLADEEIAKRTKALANALVKRDEVYRELEKAKKNHDQKTFVPNVDGSIDLENPASATYSEAQAKEIVKLQGQLEKIDSAIDAALNRENPDFSKLKDI